VLQIEWNRRKLRAATPACVTLRRVTLLLEQFGYEAYFVGRPYVPLNFGWWHDAYEARALQCPPRCTGDIVALRRGWAAREAVVRELAVLAAPPAAPSTQARLRTRSSQEEAVEHPHFQRPRLTGVRHSHVPRGTPQPSRYLS